jgi:hypothetical protein
MRTLSLSLTLSVTVYAVTTVLCAFMAVLGLGAAVAGRVVPQLLFGLAPVEIWLTNHLGSNGFAFGAGRFLIAFAILLIPCTLMGMTLPLLSRAVVRRDDLVAQGGVGPSVQFSGP